MREDRVACTFPECPDHAGFQMVGTQPVLVDATSSILSPRLIVEAQGGSPIPRRKQGYMDRILSALRLNTAFATRRNSLLFLAALRSRSTSRPRVLIIGGGARGAGTEQLYSSSDIDLLSFDIYATSDTQFIADAHRIPLKDGSIDGVWIQAVLEHVVEPHVVASEIHRVLSDGGLVYSEIPFMQQVHEGAYDFTRFTLSGHRYLFRDFAVVDAGPHGGAGSQLNWSVDHFARSLFRSRFAGRLLKLLSIWLVWFDLVASRSHTVDAAFGTYVLGSKSSRRISHREIVSFYTGAG